MLQLSEPLRKENIVTTDEKLASFGIKSANILIPKKEVDLTKWAVVACDQFTSQPEYWEDLDKWIGNSPSTLRIIYPEVYLDRPNKEEIINDINSSMEKYLNSNLLAEYKDCFVLVKRDTPSGTRYGLMATLDLEKYDYSKDSKSLIRATEGTILSRIPPRKEIRKHAKLEIPHIMVLISDKYRAIIEPLRDKRSSLECIYDMDLNKNGGHLTGYLVNRKEDKEIILKGFEHIYDDLDPTNPLLFAMGDGNHSLATAKSCWEDIKKELSDSEIASHPARYALVEIENIFDEGLEFEPIHRVLFSIERKTFESLLENTCSSFSKIEVNSKEELLKKTNESGQHFGFIDKSGYSVYTIIDGKKSIAAGTMQLVIDEMLEKKLGEVDYIHGEDVTIELGKKDRNIGIILPDISKDNFFPDMLKDGAYPRKTFSIGHANEKRYYMEARRID